MQNYKNFTSVTKYYYNNKFCSYTAVLDGKTMSVPNDPANTDYQDIQKWISEGGTVIDNGGNN